MNEIYVVEGSAGLYEDHHEWHVVAFTKEADAKAFVKKAQARVNRIQNACDLVAHSYSAKRKAHKSKYDPQINVVQSAYNDDVTYCCYPVNVATSVENALDLLVEENNQ